MKTYTIPVTYQVYGHLKISAESLEEAIEIAENDSALPDNPSYMECSFEVDREAIEEIG